MAEKAAHHTTTIVGHPSIFEVIAQENLSSTGYPALKKIVDVSSFKMTKSFNHLFFMFI